MLRRLGVYRTFITGILVGLFYVVIVSEKASRLLIFSDQGILDQRVFVLTFSGILGGVLYTIIVDGVVELPRFSKDGYSFEAGLLGDILLGIAGAFILEFLTSSMQASPESPYIISSAKGIIGGYGSKALMNVALNKFLRRFEDMKVEKEAAEKEVASLHQRLLEEQRLIDQLNAQIKDGISQGQLAELTYSIQHTSADGRGQIFQITKEFRHMSSRAHVFKERTQRTIPIFEALVKSDPGNHAYHAQLAFAYKDGSKPDFQASITHLNQAIDLRSEWERSSTWKYELNRAIAYIQLTFTKTGHYNSPDSLAQKITQDLLAVLEIYSLDKILSDADENNIPTPIVEWLIHNKAFLRTRQGIDPIFQQLNAAFGDERFSVTPKSASSNQTSQHSPPQPRSDRPIAVHDHEVAPNLTPPTIDSPENTTISAETIIDSADRDERIISNSLTRSTDEQTDEHRATYDAPESLPPSDTVLDDANRIEIIQIDTIHIDTPQSDHGNGSSSPPPLESSEEPDLDYIKDVLQREVTGVLSMQDWTPDLFRAIKTGLIRLKFLEADEESFEAFQQAWSQFKASVDRGGPNLIGKDSAALFWTALEQIDGSATTSNQASFDARTTVPFPSRGKSSDLKPSQPLNVTPDDDSSLNPDEVTIKDSQTADGHTEAILAEKDRTEADIPERIGTETPSPDHVMTWRSRWDDVLPEAPTHGASSITAKQDGLMFNGLLASNQMARQDLPKVEKLVDRFRRAAAKYDVPASVLGAIASRESRCGSLLDKDGLGDHGNAFGIMQIDKRHHTPAGLGGDPASQIHIDQAAEILADNLRKLRAEFPNWDDVYILKGAVAAYNFGTTNVRTKDGIDDGTTGNDYGADVIARAKFYSTLFESTISQSA